MPTTVDTLKVHLGLTGARPVDDAALDMAVAASNDWVASVRPDLPSPDEDTNPPIVWPARVDEAATLQAARLYGRRGSVQGIAAFQDAGVTVLGRMDPDVRLMLGVGEYQDSAIA